jgi:hypothetical protein
MRDTVRPDFVERLIGDEAFGRCCSDTLGSWAAKMNGPQK